VGKSLRKA
jgi:IS30 family transposase